ncbi:DUF4429 domain-containing protein [Arthrobacter sp. ES3-54]|uniref:DUF4429 domain-containing protein n=1 Tax=Arthrobacter sp. ES3-54 TaxID=1502991 RepID=UPI0024071F6D|nr:DUF4429 domain-containing protein [Arthrobacter sp. ES3-54]MDF9749185.1 hypothetical protein [Arthrobacter sp. ES3-54]
MEISARGRSGQMSFDGKFVTITREGLLAKASHGFGSGSKSIPIRSIGAVQYKPATSMTLGYVQLSISGEHAKKFSAGSISGVGRNNDIAKDENSILFAKKVTKDFEELAAAIRAAIGGPEVGAAPVEVDPLQQIEKLAALLDAGHVTQVEFDAKKAEILSRL